MTLSSHSQPLDDGTTTTGTIVFGGVAALNDKITIVDAAGTSKTYQAKAATDASAGQFNRDSIANAADGLEACIEHANGHNGSITVAEAPEGTLTLTLLVDATYRFRDKASITMTDNAGTGAITNVTKTDFGAGGGAEDIDGHTIAGGGNSAAPTVTATNGGFNSKTNNKSNVCL